MASMVKTPGAGLSQGKGGLSQGKGGGSVSPATLPTHAGGKPVVPQGPGGDLASLFMGNQGYGGGGGNVPTITQPTRESMGLPDITKMLSPRAQPPQPAAPAPRPPTMQEVQQRVAQVTPGSEVTYGGAMGGGVNPAITGSMGAPAVFLQNYERWKDRNPAYAAQMLERSPFKSLFAPVQGAAPPQPFQRSQASLMADEINRMAASRR